MKVEVLDNSRIGITLSTYPKNAEDEYYVSLRSLVEDGIATNELNLNMPLDRAIELRDALSDVISREVAKLQTENPEQVAEELAGIIDWRYKDETKL